MGRKRAHVLLDNNHRDILREMGHVFSCGGSAIVRAALDEYYDKHKKNEYAMLYQKTAQKADDVMPTENRGRVQVEAGKTNRANIIEWFTNNPNKLQKECAKALNISDSAVSYHRKKIKKEAKNDKPITRLLHTIRNIENAD